MRVLVLAIVVSHVGRVSCLRLLQKVEHRIQKQTPSVYFLDDHTINFNYRDWFKKDGKPESDKLDLYGWKLQKNDHTKNLQWAIEDFEHTTLLDERQDVVKTHLQDAKIGVVFCWGTWTGRSLPPVYEQSQQGGEARTISSWVGALLSLGQNVLLVDDKACNSRLVQDLIGPGKAILGAPTHERANLMIQDAQKRILKPCFFATDYFFSNWMPGIYAMPNGRSKMNGQKIDMSHMGYLTQCWSAKRVSPENEQYKNSILFWMKQGLEQFPQYMQQEEFWRKLRNAVKSYNSEYHDTVKLVALIPATSEGARKNLVGQKLSRYFDDNNVLQLDHRVEHNELMGILRHTKLMFGMGQTPGSPLPLDALECGAHVVLPRGQHGSYLDLVPPSANLPFAAVDTGDEFIGNISASLHKRRGMPLRDYTISDYQPKRILEKMDIFITNVQKACAAGKDGQEAQTEILNIAEQTLKDADGTVFFKPHLNA